MLYIGIDLGTSAVKLLLMNSGGEIVRIVSRNMVFHFLTRDGRSRIRRTGIHSPWKA